MVLSPSTWLKQWALFPATASQFVSAEITGVCAGASPSAGSLLMNGTVPVIENSVSFVDGILLARFSRNLAVQSVGSQLGEVPVQVDGSCTDDSLFSAVAFVTVVEAKLVSIDIEPSQTSPNPINLGSQGVIPAAILGASDFDPCSQANGVDAKTVILAAAPVVLKANGQPQASCKDVNGDGRRDLLLQFDKTKVQLTPADTIAVLEGKLVGGTPIIGADAVKVIQ
jgi:hypothetical protein